MVEATNCSGRTLNVLLTTAAAFPWRAITNTATCGEGRVTQLIGLSLFSAAHSKVVFAHSLFDILSSKSMVACISETLFNFTRRMSDFDSTWHLHEV